MNIEELLNEKSKVDYEVGELRAEKEILFEVVKQLYEMLIWCSGSEDFQEGGKARIGWENGAIPVLERAGKLIESLKESDITP